MERGQIKLVSIFAAVAFFIMFSIRGQDLPFSVIECIGSSITAGVFANILYKKMVWRLTRFTGVPNLTNITEVVFEFEHELEAVPGKAAPETRHYRKPGKIEITQSGCSIRMKIQTDQMKSKTLNGKFVLDDYSDYVLYYHYRTDSRGSADKRYPTQYGACCAEPDMLLGHWAGSYFTDQLTRGRIHFCSLDELRKKTDPNGSLYEYFSQESSKALKGELSSL